MSFVERISREYQTLDHVSLIKLCSDLKANLTMFQMLSRIDSDIEAIRELFKEDLREE